MSTEKLSRTIRIICLAALPAFIWIISSPGDRTNAESRGSEDHVELSAGSPSQEKTAEQEFKNIQVLKKIPAAQWQGTMDFIAASLGVNCSHCHVVNSFTSQGTVPTAFEKDDKPNKRTARRMMQMVFDLNNGRFNGRGAITCYTCHRGNPRPQTIPEITISSVAASPKADLPAPTVDEVLGNYIKAIGGQSVIEKLPTRIIKGTRTNVDKTVVPVEVYQKAPHKILTVTVYPANTLYSAFNGALAWGADDKGEIEINQSFLALLKRDAEFFQGANLKADYTNLHVAGKEKIGERETFVIAATARDGSFEKFYFDTQTALLVRRYRELKSVLGSLPYYTDFEDYREVDGAKLPFTVHWRIPGRTWSRRINEVKHNTAIDDAKFEKPTGKQSG